MYIEFGGSIYLSVGQILFELVRLEKWFFSFGKRHVPAAPRYQMMHPNPYTSRRGLGRAIHTVA